MLAKLWKKVLLAICIVACIYNIMSKFINRSSLELNLDAATEGTSIFSDFLNNTEENKITNSDTIDGVLTTEETTTEEVTQTEETQEQESGNSEYVVVIN